MNKQTIDDIIDRLPGKRVLVRVDFNVPIADGVVGDDTRLRAAIPTVKRIAETGAKVILVSHLGRPKSGPEPKYSLRPVAARFAELIGKPVSFSDDCIGLKPENTVRAMGPGDICLLENLRFHAAEERNDPEFARRLAASADIYVNDAFGSAHRAHASTEGVTKFLRTAVAGYLMEKELDFLGRLLTNPKRPLVAVLGGAKISGKLEVLKHLMQTVDVFLIGGGMAFTFLKAQGKPIGKSLVENDLVDTARLILHDADKNGKKIVLPWDCVVSKELSPDSLTQIVAVEAIPDDMAGFDIGPQTIKDFDQALQSAGTIFWNGPMGVFETPPYDEGTKAIANSVAHATDLGAISVVGGGDSVAAVHQAGMADHISHISTGGGASLEFLEGKVLPGVAALNNK
jgi:phosphoglycerate kinase